MSKLLRPLVLFLALLTGCPSSFPVTPSVAATSTYKVYNAEGTGTAWVVSDGYLMTAGHVCKDNQILLLENLAGVTTPAVVVLYHYAKFPDERDACLLKAARPVAPPLVLARGLPTVGTPTGLVSYPYGDFRVDAGSFLGPSIKDGWFDQSADGDPGSSGGAVFTAGGVIGLHVSCGILPGGVCSETVSSMVPVGVLRDLLAEAGVDPVNPPEEPR